MKTITKAQGLKLIKENNLKRKKLQLTEMKETYSAENSQYQVFMDKFKFSQEQSYSYRVTIWDFKTQKTLMDLGEASKEDFKNYKNATS